jgi:hypothetical protein
MQTNFQVIIISKDQEGHIEPMVNTVKGSLPGIDILYVLDRDTSSSRETLLRLNVDFIEKTDGFDFDAGGAREMGLMTTPMEKHILFLDGDRIPQGLSIDILIDAVGRYDLTLIKLHRDHRPWFTPDFVENPHVYPVGYVPYIREGMYDFESYSCGMLLSSSARKGLVKEFNEVFPSLLRGRYGEEDNMVAARLAYLGKRVGGFPNTVYLEGCIRTDPKYYDGLYVNKEKARIMFQDLGYTPYPQGVYYPPVKKGTPGSLRGLVKGLGTPYPTVLPYNFRARDKGPSDIFVFYSVKKDSSNVEERKANIKYIGKGLKGVSANRVTIYLLGEDGMDFSSREEEMLGYTTLGLFDFYEKMLETALLNPYHSFLLLSEANRGITSNILFWLVDSYERDASILLRSNDLVGPVENGDTFFSGWVTGEYLSKISVGGLLNGPIPKKGARYMITKRLDTTAKGEV